MIQEGVRVDEEMLLRFRKTYFNEEKTIKIPLYNECQPCSTTCVMHTEESTHQHLCSMHFLKIYAFLSESIVLNRRLLSNH